MKFNNKFFSMIAVAAAGVMLFTGCQKDFEYTPAEVPSGDQVYFPSTTVTSYTLSKQNPSFTISLARGAAEGALTVGLTSTCDTDNAAAGAFTFPTSASFGAGEKSTSITVTYDPDLVEVGVNYGFTIAIDKNSTFDYGMSEISITMTLPITWTELGKGYYADWFWGVSDDSDVAQVTFYQSDVDEHQFRITNPYVALNGQNTYFEFRVLQVGDTFYNQTVDIPDLVGYQDYLIEHYDYYDDDLYILFPGRFTSLANPTNWVYNYVYEYQPNGLPGIIVLSPYYYMFNTGGWNHTQDETIEIYFPGVSME